MQTARGILRPDSWMHAIGAGKKHMHKKKKKLDVSSSSSASAFHATNDGVASSSTAVGMPAVSVTMCARSSPHF